MASETIRPITGKNCNNVSKIGLQWDVGVGVTSSAWPFPEVAKNRPDSDG